MRELVIARQVAVALMSEVMDMKAPEIKLYVSKDRTSIIHMLKEHNNAIDTSACYRSYYAQLLERITEIN
jgi:chromosomal replication initiation ATPase DnaA